MAWRIAKIAGITFAALAATLVLVVGLLVAGFFSQPTARMVLGIAGDATGYTITCQEFDGNIFSQFACRGLSVSDSQGEFFRAGQFEFGWHFFAALTGQIDIDHLRVAGASLTRSPESQTEETVEPPSLPDWPGIGISVGELALRQFVIALPDSPEVCLNGTASAEVSEPILNLDAQIARCGAEGSVVAFARIDSNDIQLNMETMDDGDLISILFGWDGAGETEIQLVGSGPLTSFSGHLDAVVIDGGNAFVDIAALQGNGAILGGIGIDGEVALAPGRAPDWAPATEGSIAAQVLFDEDGGMRIDNGALQWGNANFNFALVRSGDGAMNGQLAADIGAYDGAAAFQSANLDLNIQGNEETQVVNGNYAVNGFCAGEICAQQIGGTLEANYGGDALAVQTEGNATALQISDPVNDILGNQTAYNLTANYALDAQTGQIEGTLQGAQGDVALEGQVALAGGTQGNGRVVLSLDQNAVIGGTTLPDAVTASVVVEDFVAGGPLSGTMELASAMLDATGAFTLAEDQTLDVTFGTTRADPERLTELTGFVFSDAPSLSAMVTGTTEAPVISAEASIPGLTVDDFTLSDAAWNLDASRAETGWVGDTTLDAGSSAGAIVFSANITQPDNEPLRVMISDSRIAEAEIAGEIVVPGGETPPTGMITIDGNAISPAGNYLGEAAVSTGTIILNLEDDNGVQHAALVIDLQEVTFGDQLVGASVDGNLDYDFEAQAADAELTLVQEEDNVTFAANAQMGEETVVNLRTLDGAWAETQIRLLEPAVLRSSAGTMAVSGAVLAFGDGRANVTASQDETGLNAQITLDAIPVEPFLASQGYPDSQGEINAELVVGMTPGMSEGNVELSINDFAFATIARDIIPADLTMRGVWDGTDFTLNGEITGLHDMPARFDASLPLRRTGEGYAVALEPNAPISGNFSGTAQAERFIALLPIAEHNLTGAISATLTIEGTPENPLFSGVGRLQNGTYESLQLGTKLEALNATINASSDRAFDLEVNATDGGAGRVTMTGNLSFDENAQPVISSMVNITNAYLVRRDEYTARGSGQVSVNFPEGGRGSIEGNFRTSEVRVDLGQPLPPGVEEIQVVEINRPAELGVIEEEPEAEGPDFINEATLDFEIVMPNNVRVEGYGVNAEWQGNIDIGGTVGAPQITGEISIVRGFAEFLGREFQLEGGSVIPDANAAGGARVNLTGVYEEADLSVEINITGPAASPEIEWTSVPALPQDEIISRVYFGRSSPQLSAYEAIQLAQLSGALGDFGGGGGGVLGFARNLAGLDVLRIEAPESGDISNPTITVGKYVTDRVYVGARRDADTSSSAIEVEVDITPHISAQVETGTDNSQAAAVNWQWDY
jgi:autotransporter translocation and assembly factor TamB